MRSFFFLLLATNLVFLGWYLSQEHEQDEKPAMKLAHNGLTLLTELPSEERPSLREGVQALHAMDSSNKKIEQDSLTASNDTPEATDTDTSSVKRQCMRLSGLNEATLTETLRGRLQGAGITVLRQGSEQAKRTNYWVIIPPYPKREQATEAAAILKRKGISDFYIISSGEHENALSLGVFSTRQHAERRLERIVTLKTSLPTPTITTKKVPAKVYWLEYQVSKSAQRVSVEALLRDFSLSDPKEIGCE